MLSFADGDYKQRASTFLRETKNMNMYSYVDIQNLDTLPPKFVSEHLEHIQVNVRGFGYWIWKPLIILEKLKKMPRNEILVYADIGFTQNPAGRDRMIEYALIAQASPFGLLSFMHPYTEYHWTKADLALRLGVSDNLRIMATSQLGSGLIVMAPTDHTISIMEDWLDLALEDNYHFSTDVPSRAQNDKRFIEHRHDQSIGSLLRKLRGTEITFYETEEFKAAYHYHSHEWPMLATRLRE
jgi:hypothetical protein